MRPSAVPRQRRSDRVPRPQDRGDDPNSLFAGRRRQQQRPTALGTTTDPQAGGYSDAAGATGGPEQQWLAELHPTEPSLLNGGGTRRDEATRDLQHTVRRPHQPKAPERQYVAER